MTSQYVAIQIGKLIFVSNSENKISDPSDICILEIAYIIDFTYIHTVRNIYLDMCTYT